MNDKQLALDVLRNTLRDTGAEHADRVRAAKLLLDHEAQRTAQGAAGVLDATDAELLAIARGDSPPLMGPAVPATCAVPSAAGEVPRGTSNAPSAPDEGADGEQEKAPLADALGRVPAAFLSRGPKTDPPISSTPAPVSGEGPKMNPANLTRRGRPRKKAPEPWE